MDALIDTNILVYAFDPGAPEKMRVAELLLEQVIRHRSAYLPFQAIVEFVAVTSRPRGKDEEPLLDPAAARREAEEMLDQFPVLYPTDGLLRTAIRGTATYQLSWWDALIWAYADYYGLPELISEDFQHGRHYGTVRAVNPFLDAETVHESPAPYGAGQSAESQTGKAKP